MRKLRGATFGTEITAMTTTRLIALAALLCVLPAAAQGQDENEDASRDVRSAFDQMAPADMMGWTIIPPPVNEDAAELSELERLSRSPSGVTFGLDAYDAERDNSMVPVSVTLRALDKITATYRDIEIPIDETAPFGPLTLLPRTCDKRPPEETPETTVFLEVYTSKGDVSVQRARAALGSDDIPTPRSTIRLPGEAEGDSPQGDALFMGWMFASSPSLNALEHPVYDVWVIDCKMVEPSTDADPDSDI